MNITVIGACGRTGKEVCQEAVKRGHKVTGLAREKCQIKGVHFVVGDAKDPKSVSVAIKRADVVISTIGHVKLGEEHTQTQAIKVVITAMQDNGIKRIISLTGTGVRVAGDRVSLTDRLLNLPLSIVDKSRVQDGVSHYQSLKKSDLNWTILRVLKLSNGNMVQNFKLTSSGPAMNLISRKTVAKALIDIAESDEWNKQLPVASKK